MNDRLMVHEPSEDLTAYRGAGPFDQALFRERLAYPDVVVYGHDTRPRVSFRRWKRGGSHAVQGLVRLAAWTTGRVASVAANRRRPPAAVAVPDVRRVGQGAWLPLQRPLRRDPRRQAPERAGRALPRHLVGDLAGHRPADRRRDGRSGQLSRRPSARHEPQGLRRADLVHVLVFAGP